MPTVPPASFESKPAPVPIDAYSLKRPAKVWMTILPSRTMSVSVAMIAFFARQRM
jgi:hypothetical protein